MTQYPGELFADIQTSIRDLNVAVGNITGVPATALQMVTSGNRPILGASTPGSCFDTTLNKVIFWNNGAWYDGQGNAVAASRPVQFGWRSDPASIMYPQEIAFLGSGAGPTIGVGGALGSGMPDFLLAFATFGLNSWPNLVVGAQSQLTEFPVYNVPLFWAIPLTITGTHLSAVASGAGDATFTSLAQLISAGTASTQTTIWVRIGWEMNGNWFPWGAISGNTAADFVSAYNRAAAIFIGIDPRFRFCWCPDVGGHTGSPDPTSYYPSDSYVDAIGGDVYASTSTDTGDPYVSWNTYSLVNSGFTGLNTLTTLSAAHSNKPLMIPEWGVDADSFEYWISSFMAWARTNNILMHMYFDKSGSINTTISDNSKPSTAAEFLRQLAPVVTVTSPATYNASTSATTYLPLCASKPQCTFTFVGAAPTGFTITNNNCLQVATTALLGANRLTVRATDERGNSGDLAMTVYVQSGALSSWSMTQLGTSAQLWFDVSDAASLQQSGGFLTGTIADKTGNGFTGTKTGTSITYGAAAHNTLPALGFNGGGWLEISNPTSLINTTVPQTFAMAYYGDTNVGTGFKSPFGAGDAAGDITMAMQTSSGQIKYYAGGTSGAAQSSPNMHLVDAVTLSKFMPAGSGFNSGRSLLYMRHNGVLQATMSLPPYTGTPPMTRFTWGGIPAASAGFSNPWRGFMSEFSVINNITPSQEVLLEGYLAWKWGTQALLPSTHCCANAIPLAV